MWEAVVTLALFPTLVGLAYMADRGLPWGKTRIVAENSKQIELGPIQSGECKLYAIYFA